MITLLANPASRSGKGKRLWDGWLRSLTAANVPFRLLETCSREHCELLAEQTAREERAVRAMPESSACASGMYSGTCPTNSHSDASDSDYGAYPSGATGNGSPFRSMIVALGGDGTINAVVSGMMRARSEIPFGVLYAGTSPDFCRFHGIARQPEAALRTLLHGAVTRMDVAEVTRPDTHLTGRKEFFACSCNVGLGAATARFANTYRRYLGDRMGTGIGLAGAMVTHRSFACRLTVDGESQQFERANHIIVLKNPYIASGLRINLPTTPDDGGLHAIVIHGQSKTGLLRLGKKLYSGDWSGHPGVAIRRCSSVTVEAIPQQETEWDGDPQGCTPVSVKLLPKALPLVCGPVS